MNQPPNPAPSPLRVPLASPLAGVAAQEPSLLPLLGWSPLAGALAVAPLLPSLARAPCPAAAAAVAWGAATLAIGGFAVAARVAKVCARTPPGVGEGIVLAVPLLAGFLALVARTTHHRPLGAATVAFTGAALLLGLPLFAARAVTLASQWTPTTGRVVRLGLRGIAALVVVGILGRLLGEAAGALGTLLVEVSLGGAASVALLLLPGSVAPRRSAVAVVAFALPVALGVAVGLAESVACTSAWQPGF